METQPVIMNIATGNGQTSGCTRKTTIIMSCHYDILNRPKGYCYGIPLHILHILMRNSGPNTTLIAMNIMLILYK